VKADVTVLAFVLTSRCGKFRFSWTRRYAAKNWWRWTASFHAIVQRGANSDWRQTAASDRRFRPFAEELHSDNAPFQIAFTPRSERSSNKRMRLLRALMGLVW